MLKVYNLLMNDGALRNFSYLPSRREMILDLSNEKNPGWLGDVGDYTTQLYRDYNKPL